MSRGVNPSDGYLEALVKNMPSEMVAGYLAVIGMVSGSNMAPTWALWLIWAVFLVATPFYLWLVKPGSETEPRPWWQVWIFSPVSFFVWSMTTSGPWSTIGKAQFLGGILVILLSLVIFPLVSMGIAKATR
jgi:hypothetical protein